MVIGLDVDGVLWDIEKFQLEQGQKFFRKKNMPVVDPNGFGIREVFDCSRRDETLFWTLNIPVGFLEKARDHAAEVVRELKKKGHHIFIVTSRAKTTETTLLGAVMRGLVRAWLKVNAIEYDGIVFCDDNDDAHSKERACRELALDVMVEDRLQNLEVLKNLTRVIGFKTRNNQFYEDAAVIFVQSFIEVRREIERLEEALRQEHQEKGKGISANPEESAAKEPVRPGQEG